MKREMNHKMGVCRAERENIFGVVTFGFPFSHF